MGRAKNFTYKQSLHILFEKAKVRLISLLHSLCTNEADFVILHALRPPSGWCRRNVHGCYAFICLSNAFLDAQVSFFLLLSLPI